MISYKFYILYHNLLFFLWYCRMNLKVQKLMSYNKFESAFIPGTPSEAVGPVSRAFTTWAANTHFSFSQASEYESADIKISFERGDHGDGSPFDGVGGVLAHAFAPTDGRLHFDAVEHWAVGAVPNFYDVETVALHEIGHLLGLQHSSVEGAIMWPSIMGGTTKGLHADDVEGIRVLYTTMS